MKRAISHIDTYYTRTYSDTGQVKAYCGWYDAWGRRGRTEGKPDSPHMQALKDRAIREGRPVTEETW